MVALLAVAAVLAGCSGTPADPATSPPEVDRVDVVARTREQVVEPAQALGTAAAEVAGRLESLIDAPSDLAITGVRDAVDGLDDARADVAGVDLEHDTEDVRAAADALEAAVDSALALGEAAARTADTVEQAHEADARLGELVATWDEAGSRSELLARFDEVAEQADALAGELRPDPPDPCPGPLEDRAVAAAFVAEATRDLHELVAQRDGLGFDERRAELAEAPYGRDDDGEARNPVGPVDEDTCPTIDAAEDAAGDVAAALQDLQRALNPADLTE